jgi:hypothetical protein
MIITVGRDSFGLIPCSNVVRSEYANFDEINSEANQVSTN